MEPWVISAYFHISAYHTLTCQSTCSKPHKKLKGDKSQRLLWLHASAWQTARAGGWLRLKCLSGRQKSTKLVLFHISGHCHPGHLASTRLSAPRQPQTDAALLKHQLDQSSFILENKALTKILFSVSRFQSTRGDTSLPWVICGNLQKVPGSNTQRTGLQRAAEQD